MNLSTEIQIEEPHSIDEGVLIGYIGGREISNKIIRIGRSAKIRSGTVIYAGTTIGDNLETGHNVVIREENVIGKNLKIWNNSVIDYGCKIGDNVQLHCDVYVSQFTIIEDNVFLAPGVMIANDLYPVRKVGLKGPTIKKGARIGINVTILPEVIIGEDSLIGAGSVVTKDIPPGFIAYGNPAKAVRKIDPNIRNARCEGD